MPDKITRRTLLETTALLPLSSAFLSIPIGETEAQVASHDIPSEIAISLNVNGETRSLTVDPRSTLLDTLRNQLDLTGTKKGCDRGECGACTIHVDGRRVLSCMMLAVVADGKAITTIEGLSTEGKLHPIQAAFIEHDAFQCGYCTPGQIMSAVACIREGNAGSEEEIREHMSGNICRCSAYPQIVWAIRSVAELENI